MTAPLRVRADFDAPECVVPEEHQWIASPEAGVERVMLDRIGDEQAIATSLVRYAPGARFAEHFHPSGEEFLVLEGVFEDEFGRYPAGTYVRNPSGSHHRPGSGPGCLLFVKLRQFQPGDAARLVVDTGAFAHASADAVAVQCLHQYRDETVTIVNGGKGGLHRPDVASVPQEVLVVEGSVRANGQSLGRLGWLRVPAGRTLEIEFESPGRVLVKTRPLPA